MYGMDILQGNRRLSSGIRMTCRLKYMNEKHRPELYHSGRQKGGYDNRQNAYLFIDCVKVIIIFYTSCSAFQPELYRTRYHHSRFHVRFVWMSFSWLCSFRQHSLNRDYSSEVFPSDGSYYKADTDKSRVTSRNKIVKSCSPVMLSQQLHSVSYRQYLCLSSSE